MISDNYIIAVIQKQQSSIVADITFEAKYTSANHLCHVKQIRRAYHVL